jgi:2-methylisocitrate lyase-like PEP mutase family enzyme
MPKSPSRVLRGELLPGTGLLMPGAGKTLTARAVDAAGSRAVVVGGAAVAKLPRQSAHGAG